MKCPRCGASNPGDQLICFRCGSKLSSDKANFETSDLWSRENDNKNTKRRKLSPTRTLALDDEAQGSFFEKDSRITRSAKTNREKLQDIDDGKIVNVILPPQIEDVKIGKHKRVRWIRLFLIVIISLSLLFGIGFGGYKLFKLISTSISKYKESIIEATAEKAPLVERIMVDGKPWHRITFYGDEGEYILITNLHRTLPIHDGEAILRIDDLGYIPDSPDVDIPIITVEITALRFDISGEETPVDVPSFDIEIPISPLSIIVPEEQGFTTFETRMDIKMKVIPGSRVTIGTISRSDDVSDEGYVSTAIDLLPIGDNVFNVVVQTLKHRMNVYEVIINHPEMDVPIQIDDTYKNGEAETEKIVLTGTTVPEAELLVDALLIGEMELDPLTGEFTLNIKLPKYGWNRITLTATLPSGESSKLIYAIERTADMSSYTRSAWSLVDNFNYLTVSTNSLIGQEFKCVGTITKKLDADTRNIYQMDVGADGNPMYIAIEYEGNLKINVNSKYEMFADVTGTFEQYPLLMAQFVSFIPDDILDD